MKGQLIGVRHEAVDPNLGDVLVEDVGPDEAASIAADRRDEFGDFLYRNDAGHWYVLLEGSWSLFNKEG